MKTSKLSVKQIESWSYSRYSDYKLCPFKAYNKHVLKIKEPPNDAMARGDAIHKMAEGFVKGKISRLPKELKQFADDFKWMKAQYKKKISGLAVEETWAFTKDWDQTTWNDWVNCWVRIKLDAAHHEDNTTLIVTDWKTGKFRPDMQDDYLEQLELYAPAAFLIYPHIERVKPRLVYLDLGLVYPKDSEELVYERKDLPKLIKLWEKRVKPMLSDKIFAPRPNDKCRWCHFRKSNAANGGGQCKY